MKMEINLRLQFSGMIKKDYIKMHGGVTVKVLLFNFRMFQLMNLSKLTLHFSSELVV
jgi:hypothetical protein